MEILKAEHRRELVDNAQKDFFSGLQSLSKAVAILKKTDVSVTPLAEVMKNIKKLSFRVCQAHKYFTKSLGFCEDAEVELSELIETKVEDITLMKRRISNKVTKIKELKQTSESISKQIESNKKQEYLAITHFDRAGERLKAHRDELEKKRQDQDILLKVGFGIGWIPIIGWITGGRMLWVGLTTMQDAIKASENNVESAKEDVRSCQYLLLEKIKEGYDLEQKLVQENAEKQQTEVKLKVLEAELQRLREEQKRSLDVQEKLRKTCHFMTKITGKSKVLKMETTNANSLEPLFTPLKEIAIMFDFEDHNKLKVTTLLFNDTCMDITGLSLKLKAICEKTQDEVDMLV